MSRAVATPGPTSCCCINSQPCRLWRLMKLAWHAHPAMPQHARAWAIRKHTHTHTQTHTHTHRQTHAHPHTHTHTYTRSRVEASVIIYRQRGPGVSRQPRIVSHAPEQRVRTQKDQDTTQCRSTEQFETQEGSPKLASNFHNHSTSNSVRRNNPGQES